MPADQERTSAMLAGNGDGDGLPDTQEMKLRKPEEKEHDEGASSVEAESDKDGFVDILGSGRLKRRITEEGIPDSRPAEGSAVKVKYKAWFEGQLVQEDNQLCFHLQECEVIRALDLVVALMNVAESCDVISDPDLAYGPLGLPPLLPGNAKLHLHVTLLSCESSVPPLELPLAERKLVGHRKKERGNFWYSRQDFTSAVKCYRKAVEYFDDAGLDLEAPIDRFALPEEMQRLLEDRLKAYNNLAQAQMKLQSWPAALASLKCVLKVEPNNEKALFRKAKCLEERGQLEEATGILRRVVRLYSENKAAQADLSRLCDRLKSSRQEEERRSKRMLGLDKSKKAASLPKATSGLLSNKQWIVVGLVMGGAGVLMGTLLSYWNGKL